MERLNIRSLKAKVQPGSVYRIGGCGTYEFKCRKENVAQYFGEELKR